MHTNLQKKVKEKEGGKEKLVVVSVSPQSVASLAVKFKKTMEEVVNGIHFLIINTVSSLLSPSLDVFKAGLISQTIRHSFCL